MTRIDAEILTVNDLAELFACDKETAAARLTSGDLPGVKVGRSWIIPRQAFFERLNEKALEEAANRRAQQASIRRVAQQHGNSFNEPSGSRTSASSALLAFDTASGSRGRRRKQPPILPPLPSK